MTQPLQERLQADVLVAPGVHDALTALLATAAGFEALYVSGAAIAHTRLGRPDAGLVSMNEIAETIALIRDRLPTPLIVDADGGYGNILNVQRTVRSFERAGATAIQIEDRSLPHRCDHLHVKTLIPEAEMVGKVRAALDARASENTLIIARTDAVGVEGVDRAIQRAWHYAEAGADVLFVETPQSREDLTAVTTALRGLCPLMVNVEEDGGDAPPLPADALGKLGFRLIVFPGIIRAFARTAEEYYGSLAGHGSNTPFRGRMLDADGLNALIGIPEMQELSRAYEGKTE